MTTHSDVSNNLYDGIFFDDLEASMQVLKNDVRATRAVNTSSIRERIDASKFSLN